MRVSEEEEDWIRGDRVEDTSGVVGSRTLYSNTINVITIITISLKL